eukprot:scaffold16206_cov134-Isochrysis_galbana.AAC.7
MTHDTVASGCGVRVRSGRPRLHAAAGGTPRFRLRSPSYHIREMDRHYLSESENAVNMNVRKQGRRDAAQTAVGRDPLIDRARGAVTN